jgi:RNA polymerase sigma-70 factor (ECF subfamily)
LRSMAASCWELEPFGPLPPSESVVDAGQPSGRMASSKPMTGTTGTTGWAADVELARHCQAGVSGAFEQLYGAHAPRLFGLACRMVGRQDAEDLLQEIFLTAHRKLGLYRGQSSLGTWLFKLATNQCLDHLRSRGARWAAATVELPSEPASAGAAAGAVVGVVDRLDLERAIGSLPTGCRLVFVLHDVEGCQHQEIAGLLGISDGTSKSQLHKARLRLREMLSPGAGTTGVEA